MTIQQAIEKAIEGGWKPENYRTVLELNPNNSTGVHPVSRASLTHLEIFLDPAFWQCLGKAMGWKMTSCDFDAGDKNAITRCSHCHFGAGTNCREHLYHWHSLIDHLANKGTVEEWFGKLN